MDAGPPARCDAAGSRGGAPARRARLSRAGGDRRGLGEAPLPQPRGARSLGAADRRSGGDVHDRGQPVSASHGALPRERDGRHRAGAAPARRSVAAARRAPQPGGQPARATPGSVPSGGALSRRPLRRGLHAMKFFLDTASLKDISWATQAGLIDGITTNPSLLAKQAGDLDPRDVLKEICSLVEGPVSAEVVAVEADAMVREGQELAKIADNIVVKIPMLEAGMVAVRRLAAAGIKTNVTLCFSSVQCLIAAKAGAAYVSPFIGRLDDVGQEGMDVIREARVIFDNYQLATAILAASIRHPRHVVEAAMLGADVATLPPDVLKKLLQHPLTDRGLEQFLADWKTLGARPKARV